jgi:hypothetical protein
MSCFHCCIHGGGEKEIDCMKEYIEKSTVALYSVYSTIFQVYK